MFTSSNPSIGVMSGIQVCIYCALNVQINFVDVIDVRKHSFIRFFYRKKNATILNIIYFRAKPRVVRTWGQRRSATTRPWARERARRLSSEPCHWRRRTELIIWMWKCVENYTKMCAVEIQSLHVSMNKSIYVENIHMISFIVNQRERSFSMTKG